MKKILNKFNIGSLITCFILVLSFFMYLFIKDYSLNMIGYISLLIIPSIFVFSYKYKTKKQKLKCIVGLGILSLTITLMSIAIMYMKLMMLV